MSERRRETFEHDLDALGDRVELLRTSIGKIQERMAFVPRPNADRMFDALVATMLADLDASHEALVRAETTRFNAEERRLMRKFHVEALKARLAAAGDGAFRDAIRACVDSSVRMMPILHYWRPRAERLTRLVIPHTDAHGRFVQLLGMLFGSRDTGLNVYSSWYGKVLPRARTATRPALLNQLKAALVKASVNEAHAERVSVDALAPTIDDFTDIEDTVVRTFSRRMGETEDEHMARLVWNVVKLSLDAKKGMCIR